MTESEAHLLAFLRELDDPDWLERPQRYNRGETTALFGSLATRLEGDFAARCTAEQDTQDSSEYGRIAVPEEATVCGTRIVVCVSKFGSLALVCADNPGAFFGTEDAQAEGELDRADLANCPGTFSGPAGGIASSAPSNGHTDSVRPVPARQPLLGVADKRRRERFCTDGCTHAWHQLAARADTETTTA
ncbi:DUF5958 family protein [Streptomyces sp. NPDC058231]|uniref:DUF5958 family protein n=1 Tax=Streptomyces sp. NPDC058231 TaxID=3346392 RepID=UPI0036ED749F